MITQCIFSYAELASSIIAEQELQINDLRDELKRVTKCTNCQLPTEMLDNCCRALVQQGKKIQAIKLYRGVMGIGLKDAKNVIDQM